MRVLFVTGNRPENPDGVADHVSLLAARLRREGHAVRWLAFRDPDGEPGEHEDGALLRLRRGEPAAARAARAASWVAAFRPDVASVHWVPFSWGERGLMGPESPALARALRGVPTHLVLHEPWVGIEHGRPWRERLLGLLQRRSLARFVRALRPRLAQTSTDAYARAFAGIGLRCAVRPVFSNLPVAGADVAGRGSIRLALTGGAGAAPGRLLASFGLLHREWDPAPFGRFLREAVPDGEPLRLVSLGRWSGSSAACWERLGAALGDRATLHRGGEADPATLARWLDACDWAFTSTPLPLVGKSGTVAAARDHGLPVIVPRRAWPGPRDVDPVLAADPAFPGPGTGLASALARGEAPRFPREASFGAAFALLAADLGRVAAGREEVA